MSNLLLQHTFEQLEREITPNSRLVVALSGGVDSRVLLDLVAQWRDIHNHDCLAIHVNHGLSPHAEQWARHCQDICSSYQIDCIVERVQLDTGNGESLEAQARTKRYQVFEKHMTSNSVLLLAQHLDDQTETVLLALKRGSGPKGLSGMARTAPFANGLLFRPFIEETREQVEHYAQDRKLDWVNDESNLDTRFDRNFLRHQITPALQSRWPGFQQAIARSAQLCAEQELLIEELLEDKLNLALTPDSALLIPVLQSCLERVRQQLIRLWLGRLNELMPSRTQLQQIWDEVANARQDASPVLQIADYQIRRFEQCLYVVNQWQSLESWSQPIKLDKPLELPDQLGQLIVESSNQGNLDIDKLNQAPLSVIFEPMGLQAHPVGRNGSRKLKKLFQEYKVPSWLRRRTPIIIQNQNVVAVADLFVDVEYQGTNCQLVWHRDRATHS